VEKQGMAGVFEDTAATRDIMKYRNGDISLDEAVEYIIGNDIKFSSPNVDLLVSAIADTPW
jgi:hypothetical protein